MTCVSRQFFSFPQDFADVLYGLPQIFACVFCICSYFFFKMQHMFGQSDEYISLCFDMYCLRLQCVELFWPPWKYQTIQECKQNTRDSWLLAQCGQYDMMFTFWGHSGVWRQKIVSAPQSQRAKATFLSHSFRHGLKIRNVKKKWCHFPVMENVKEKS